MKIKKLVITCLFCVLTGNSAQSADLCAPSGYVVNFFNGIWNTKLQTIDGATSLSKSLLSTYKNEPLEYEVFYNQTTGVLGLGDVAEVFEQRAAELDGALVNRWEIFWEVLSSTSNETSFIEKLTSKIGSVSSETLNLLGSLYTDIISKSVAGWSYLLSNPPTDVDLAIQETRIKELITQKKKILLLGHSQGNLFLNRIYDVALTLTDANSIKAVHIAPASPTLRGEHSLADLDLVINGLRAQGLSTVPSITVSIPASHLVTDDYSGHTLKDTYLNPKRDTLQQVKNFALAALNALDCGTTPPPSGLLNVSFNPNPAPISSSSCLSITPSWSYTGTLTETAGVGITINSFTWDFYDKAGNFLGSQIDSATNFTNWFNACGLGSSYIAPSTTVCANLCVNLGGRNVGGSVIMTFRGQDNNGNQVEFSGREFLQGVTAPLIRSYESGLVNFDAPGGDKTQ